MSEWSRRKRYWLILHSLILSFSHSFLYTPAISR